MVHTWFTKYFGNFNSADCWDSQELPKEGDELILTGVKEKKNYCFVCEKDIIKYKKIYVGAEIILFIKDNCGIRAEFLDNDGEIKCQDKAYIEIDELVFTKNFKMGGGTLKCNNLTVKNNVEINVDCSINIENTLVVETNATLTLGNQTTWKISGNLNTQPKNNVIKSFNPCKHPAIPTRKTQRIWNGKRKK